MANEVKAVLIDDPETIGMVNQFAKADNRFPSNAARELIKRGFEFSQPGIPSNANPSVECSNTNRSDPVCQG